MSNKITSFPTLQPLALQSDGSFSPQGTGGGKQTGQQGFASQFTGDIFTSRGRFGNGNDYVDITAQEIKSANFVTGSTGWRIAYDGTAEFNSITIAGTGNLNYGKTSFADTVNAGYWFSADGMFIGNAGDTIHLKYTLATGAVSIVGGVIDGTSTIGGRLASVLNTAIDSAGHFADDAINTANGTILDAFTFGVSGALQIGTYSAGVSGDIRISPTGILGRDKDNNTTFSINATTGVAVLNGLVVGTNVGIGTAQTSGQVTTIVGNTVTTNFVNALNITANSMSAAGLTAGAITSKAITLSISAGTGDSYIAGGNALDLSNWSGGDATGGAVILGLDDSDSDKGKFFAGNYYTKKYIKFDGTSFLTSNVKSVFNLVAGENLTAGDVVYWYQYGDSGAYKASANYAGVRNSQVLGVVMSNTNKGDFAQIQYSGLYEGSFGFSAANQYVIQYLKNATENDVKNVSVGGTTNDVWLTNTGHRSAQITSTISAGTRIDRVKINCAYNGSAGDGIGYVILQGYAGGKPDNNNLAISNSVTITSNASYTFEFPYPYITPSGASLAIVLVWESGSGIKANRILSNPDGDLGTFVCTTTDAGVNWTVTTDDWQVYSIQNYTNAGLVSTTPGTVSVKVGKSFGQNNLFLSNPANS